MTPRRLRQDPQTLPHRPQALVVARPAPPPGWTRKTCAMVLHLACLGLFGLSVVWPVVGPLASGQVARDHPPHSG